MRTVGLTLRVDEARERRDALDQAWYGVLARADLRPVLLPNAPDVAFGMGGLVEDLGLDGVILTGGNDLVALPGGENTAPERDAVEAALIDACAERGLPLLGVCRGYQMLVHHLGGTLVRVDGHVATTHGLTVVADGPMPLGGRTEVNSYHGWGVPADGLGPVLRPAASAPDGTIEAAFHPDRPQWGLMWHPEREPFDDGDVALLRALFHGHGGGDAA